MGNALTWTMGRQLASFGSNTYTYNEDGIRTSKTVNNVITTYYLDGTNIIEQSDGTNTLHFYYDSNDEIIGFAYNEADYFYVKNAMSDIIGIVDDSGNLIVSYAYDAWGKVLSVTGSNTELGNLNPFRYRSYYYDSDIEMYYLQSRYYDPEVCRFINSDDVNYIGLAGTVGSYNAFAYCENNAVNYMDECGRYARVLPLTIKRMIVLFGTLSLLIIALEKTAKSLSMTSYNVYLLAVAGVLGVGSITALIVKYNQDKSYYDSMIVIANASVAAPPLPPNKGGKGTQVTSKNLYTNKKKGYRIDVENPGNRQGQIHLQIDGKKYIYNVEDQMFHLNKSNGPLADKTIQNLMNDKKVIKAIAKGLKILGY